MTPHAYTEDQLVEQPAIGLFAELDWTTVSANDETFGPSGTLERETKGEVVLVAHLRRALQRLNPSVSADIIESAIDQLTRDRSAMSLEAANREVYTLPKDGIPVSVPDETGGQKPERLTVIDWTNAANNDFLLVSQFSVVGTLYNCRPDLVGFVNGLPLVVIELKKPSEPARAAFDGNLTHYKREIPALFWYNAFLIASNGTDSKVGSLTASWDRYFEWKRIQREDEPRRVSLEVMLRGTCDKTRLLDLVENFTLFSEHKSGLIKIVGQNHQFLGVNNAIAAMLKARELGHGRGGVFWQTQGSGKSFAMVFFAQKILRKIEGNWSFVVVTDRVELDEQIATTFKATGAVTEEDGEACHASSGANLRELLRGNHRYVFTLIQKFQSAEQLSDRADVVVLTDEAHRSQYDTLALNMRSALPKAMFLAFTGTPLIAGEARTKEVFGDYVSIYDFQQSVEDGATVPLFYENRTPALELVNPTLNEDIYDAIEAAELDEQQEARLERELGRQYHILTRDDRLETVAKDIVRHFLGRGFLGKAMVVSIDKATALRMHDKVRKYWAFELERCETLSNKLYALRQRTLKQDAEYAELGRRLEVLRTTDMAVIVSPAQNEIAGMQKLGLEIEPHRKRMNDEELDESFKDTENPLRLVFVCAMWLTGFDAPSCSTIYIDKPMRNHTLMQTIARANRVFPGKHSGLIVDYANVFASLERALAIYGSGKDGDTPVKDKSELVGELRGAVIAASDFCAKHHVDLAAIEGLPLKTMQRLTQLDLAVEALIAPDALRQEFYAHTRLVTTLFRAIMPDVAAVEFAGPVACINAIADSIRGKLNDKPADIAAVMEGIGEVLDYSIAGVSIPETPGTLLELSKIDFDALARKFKQSDTKKTDVEMLKAAIRAKLTEMITINKTRADYAEKFEELIESYNNGSRTIEDLFHELTALTASLNTEQQRHVRENMSEDELVIFDLLMKPAPELTDKERADVKAAARVLLARLKELLVINWRQKASATSQVRLAIEDVLDGGLPWAYDKGMYQTKCAALFQHVYERYPDAGSAVYTA
jgi:type I restriction enzyme R subunit